MTTRAGDLRYRPSIQAPTSGKDAEGVVTNGWGAGNPIWANMTPIGGEYALRKYGFTEQDISMKMECRPNPIVALGNRIVWKGKTYDVRHIAPYPDRYEVLLRVVPI
jgi:hypothetical protein